MNREILFRGRRLDTGEWAEGFYFCRDTQHYIKVPVVRNGVVVSTDYEVNHDTIGQFIGHVASRNVKIFEGDILEGDWGAAATVEWLENESGFALRLEDEQYENTVDWLDEGIIVTGKQIGRASCRERVLRLV